LWGEAKEPQKPQKVKISVVEGLFFGSLLSIDAINWRRYSKAGWLKPYFL
jgi:hypothetical protein